MNSVFWINIGALLVIYAQTVSSNTNDTITSDPEDVINVDNRKRAGSSSSWGYRNTRDWGNVNPICNSGQRQSPIALNRARSAKLPPIRYHNYRIPFATNPELVNNGHSVEMAIPPLTNGGRPTISGGTLGGRFEAVGLHFHWGTRLFRGSEHSINNRYFESEMHIVHRNVRYNTTEQALRHGNGFAVVTIMMDLGNRLNGTRSLSHLMSRLPAVINYNSKTKLGRRAPLETYLGRIPRRSGYYVYAGSLTTPPCGEAVTFVIYERPVTFPRSLLGRFWRIRDNQGKLYFNGNFRPAQSVNGRRVIYSPR